MPIVRLLLFGVCVVAGVHLPVRALDAGESNRISMRHSETVQERKDYPSTLVIKDPAGPPKKRGSIAEDLRDLETLRKGKDTPFRVVEDQAQRALEEHPAPDDQGRIYYQLAHTYGQGGINIADRAQKVVEYSQKALQYPLDPVRCLRLYNYWGDALRFADPQQPFADQRRAAAIVYLRGLKEAQKYNILDEPPGPFPAGMMIHHQPGEPPRDPEAWERKAAEVAATQKRMMYEKEMHYGRTVLIRQIVDLYRRRPYAATELRQLAEKIVGDPASVEAIMKGIEKEGGLSDDPAGPRDLPTVPLAGASPWRWPLMVGSYVLIGVAVGVMVWRIRRRRASRPRSPARP